MSRLHMQVENNASETHPHHDPPHNSAGVPGRADSGTKEPQKLTKATNQKNPSMYAYDAPLQPLPPMQTSAIAQRSTGQPWQAYEGQYAATPTEVEQSTKASRHDAQQTTPRRVRTHVDNSMMENESTGLTPLASGLRLSNALPATGNAGYGVDLGHSDALLWSERSNAQVSSASQTIYGGGLPPQPRAAAATKQGFGAVQRGATAAYADAIKALRQDSELSKDSNWPYVPGIPLVESFQQEQHLQAQQQQAQQQAHTNNPFAAQPRNGHLGQQYYQPTAAATLYNASGAPAAASVAATTHNYHLRSQTSKNTSQEKPAQNARQQPRLGMEPVTPSYNRSITTPPSLPALRPGMTPAVALHALGHLLTTSEKAELLQYNQVWFAGRAGTPKIRCNAHSMEPNGGYDDARGDYLAVTGDHIAFRYEVMGTLGRGSFGQVLRCLDHAHGGMVALKMIRNKRRFQKQAQIEASILTELTARDTENNAGIVKMLGTFTFRNHLCISFELLAANLYEHIKAGGFVGCPATLVRRVARQVLGTLSFLRRLNIVHCDLKPENILLTSRGSSSVKVIDFGSSCYADQRVYSYIQSRFYRAPEVILGLPYGPAIDIWSLACVLAELLTGHPLFPGEDEVEQLGCIMEILGPPPPALLRGASRIKVFFDPVTGCPLPPRANSRGRIHRPGTLTLESAMAGRAEPAFIDFLRRCLQWDPAGRMTPDRALQHPWLRSALDEPREPRNELAGSYSPLGRAAAGVRAV
jgi:dual specificity tyrosine-phosphorylation-regulated kinase 2/3/4